MKATIIKNGSIKLLVIPDDEFDKLAIKELNGCVVTVITDNLKFFEQSLSEGILIDSNKKTETIK